MRWFKHLSRSHLDTSLCRLMDEFGLEGYGAYWLLLEAIAEQCDDSDNVTISMSPQNWRKVLPFYPQRLAKFAQCLGNLQLFSVEVSNSLITISCPKLLKYRDEYSDKKSKKSGQCRDNIHPRSDTDTDSEQEKVLNTGGPEAAASEPKPMGLPPAEDVAEDPNYSGFTVYHAEGEMRISRKDFNSWQKSYSNLDLAAELQALSDWSRETREWPKKSAFMACSGALRKKNEARADTSWRKYRSWSESYATKRAALIGGTAETTSDVLDSGAKVLAEYITPDGFSEDEAGRIISWILAKPERAAHVSALANLADEVPGWGMLITWASNGSRGMDVGDDPRTWRKAANG